MTSNFDYGRKRVLIVDDQRAFQVMLKTMLLNFGCRVVDYAQHAEEAIKMCRHEKYDLLLVDYNLGSGLNGRELFEHLKSHDMLDTESMFFLVTGDNSKAIVLSALQMTPDDYLMKPFSQNELNLRIQKAFAKKNTLLPIFNEVKNKNVNNILIECDKVIAESKRYRNYCLLFKAELLMENKRYQEARLILEAFVKVHPHTQAQLLLGRVYYLEKNYAQAIPILSAIVKSNPMLLDSYDWLAQCFKDGGDYEQALSIVQRAIKHSHLSLSRQHLLAELALDTNKPLIAKEAFFAILMQTKNTINQNAEHLINYIQAIILVAINEDDDFKQGRLLQEISGLFHRSGHHYPYIDEDELLALEGYSMASIHKVKGDTAKAKNTLLKSNSELLTTPEQIPDWLGPQLVQLLIDLEEFDHADNCKPHVKHANTNSQKLLANISGKKDQSQVQFNQHNRLGIKAFIDNRFEQALEHFEQALKLAPLNSGAALNKVQVCLALLKRLNKPWPEMTNMINGIFKTLENYPLVEQQHERKLELKKEFNNQRMHAKQRDAKQ